VLSPETHGEGLNQLAEKLRGRLDESGAGMSIGVAQYDPSDESPEDMLAVPTRRCTATRSAEALPAPP